MTTPSIWSIANQTVDDKASGFRFEFSVDVQTNDCRLRLINQARNKAVVLLFEYDGHLINSEVQPFLLPSETPAIPPIPQASAKPSAGDVGKVTGNTEPVETDYSETR